MKVESNRFKQEILQWKSKIEAVEKSKNREIEDLRMTM